VSHSLLSSRWACRLSVLGLISPKHVPWDAPDWVYLHTLTFADPEPSYEIARQRFRSFVNWLNETGKFGVAVPEFGEKTGRLHFHLVSSVRWNAKEMWAVCARYGFGRYDVRPRPAWERRPNATDSGRIHPAAYYLAKYIGKRSKWPDALKGSRQWSIFGKRHFPTTGVRDVRITTKVLTVVEESHKPFHDFVEWRQADSHFAYRAKVRPDAHPDGVTIMREVTPEQSKQLLKLVAAGDVVGIGEYRACSIETREFADFKDKSKRIKRVIVTHKVDFGAACERREFEELLPEGANEKAVTPPAGSGDLVACTVENIRTFNGSVTYKGRVIKL